MPPTPASSDLNSHPEFSSWRSYYTNRPLDSNVSVKHTSCASCSATKVSSPCKCLTCRPLNRVTGDQCHGLPANIQLPAPFSSRLMVRHGTNTDRRTDRRMDNGRQCIMRA